MFAILMHARSALKKGKSLTGYDPADIPDSLTATFSFTLAREQNLVNLSPDDLHIRQAFAS